MLSMECSAIVGMLCIFFAGARISKGNSLILSAAVRVPLGSWKTLLDSRPIGMNAKLFPGTDVRCCCTISNDGWNGPVEDFCFDCFVGEIADPFIFI